MFPFHGARCSSIERALAYGVMGHQMDPSCFSQYFTTTSVTKAMVCAILFVG